VGECATASLHQNKGRNGGRGESRSPGMACEGEKGVPASVAPATSGGEGPWLAAVI
jgi:hypothetical protein